jgi:D-sedoheptulose 7-phosphate isomerase
VTFFSDYFLLVEKALGAVNHSLLLDVAGAIMSTAGRRRKIILAGNGGSAAMASHVAVDLPKSAGIRSINFNEADLLTCLANDYGYENVFEKALEFYGNEGDLLILISSGGQSPNVLNAARKARDLGMGVITFTGFEKDNELRRMGDLNLYVDSKSYNIVEMTHHVWLVAIADYIAAETNGSMKKGLER